MVIINNSDKTQNIKTNRFQENIQHYTTGIDVSTEKTIDLKDTISIDGQSAYILELN
jgi:hypothetical protein